MTTWKRMVVLGGCLLCVTTSSAWADPLGDRLKALEDSVKELQAVLRESRTPVADVHQRLEQMQSDIQSFQGSVDGLRQQVEMQLQDINRFRQDVDVRLRTMEDQQNIGGKPLTGAPPTSPTTAPTAAAAPAANESAQYQQALNQVHSGDYLGATTTFKQFMQAFPKSPLVPNAQFWIGDCYYAMKDYQRAIKEYQIVAERFPKHEKANTALLKQGLAFESLGLKDEARLFLQKLVAKAPNSPEARKAAEKLKILEAQKAKPSASAAPALGTGPTPLASPPKVLEAQRPAAPVPAPVVLPQPAPVVIPPSHEAGGPH